MSEFGQVMHEVGGEGPAAKKERLAKEAAEAKAKAEADASAKAAEAKAQPSG